MPDEFGQRPYYHWITKVDTLFVWSGVYGENCGLLIHYDVNEMDEAHTDDFSNRSTMVENEFFVIEKPPFEFFNRAEKEAWFIERCEKNWVNPVNEDDFDHHGVPSYMPARKQT